MRLLLILRYPRSIVVYSPDKDGAPLTHVGRCLWYHCHIKPMAQRHLHAAAGLLQW